LQLAGGLTPGPGLSTQSGDSGNELAVAEFASGAALQSAIDGGDYLSFAVQPIEGIAMYPDSVTFELWRQGAGSATEYAVLSSVSGFAVGEQLAQVSSGTSGAANQFQITGSFSAAQATTEPVEFRLYGWHAMTPLDSTHLVGASMRARFASIVGSAVDPAGQLAINGDYFHLAGSTLSIELGGHSAGVDFDVVNVAGAVDLAGQLEVSLVDVDGSPFSPALGDSFEVLTALDGVSGSFSDISLPTLGEGLDWFIGYSPNSVSLNVVASADFNGDGSVDGDDLSAWQDNFGKLDAVRANGDADRDGIVDGHDVLQWQRQIGTTSTLESNAHLAIPEPSLAAFMCSLTCLMSPLWRTFFKVKRAFLAAHE
jgi:hypothetical protein